MWILKRFQIFKNGGHKVSAEDATSVHTAEIIKNSENPYSIEKKKIPFIIDHPVPILALFADISRFYQQKSK